MLTKSNYISGLQCHKRLWLQKNNAEKHTSDETANLMTLGHEVGTAAILHFNAAVVEKDSPFNMRNKTVELINAGSSYIAEATFIYGSLYCQADIIKNRGNELDIIEVKSTTKVEPIHLDDIAFQVYVIEKAGYKIKTAFHMHLDKTYKGITGRVDTDKLFILEDVTDLIRAKLKDIEPRINEALRIASDPNQPVIDLGAHCKSPHECEFMGRCCAEKGCNADDTDSILNINGMFWREKADLINNGVKSFSDYAKCGCSSKYAVQVNCELNGTDIIRKDKIKEFLNTLSYPLYNLDYESIQQDIPLYDGVHPYEQIPFQYSLHIMDDPNSCELQHEEFLANQNEDPRRALAEKLCKDIPYGACVLAYNASFERGITKRLGDMYPDLSNHLMSFNFKDLMIPFKNRDMYLRSMKGSYSIKYVLPALYPNDPSLDYHNLDEVQNGTMAMDAYRALQTMTDPQKISKLRQNLLKYCGLDTFAMVKVLKKLYAIAT